MDAALLAGKQNKGLVECPKSPCTHRALEVFSNRLRKAGLHGPANRFVSADVVSRGPGLRRRHRGDIAYRRRDRLCRPGDGHARGRGAVAAGRQHGGVREPARRARRELDPRRGQRRGGGDAGCGRQQGRYRRAARGAAGTRVAGATAGTGGQARAAAGGCRRQRSAQGVPDQPGGGGATQRHPPSAPADPPSPRNGRASIRRNGAQRPARCTAAWPRR